MRRGALLWPWLIAMLFSAIPAVAQAPLEAAVKAAYLYKFLSYVEWPASTARPPAGTGSEGAPLAIGVLGSDALFVEFQKVIAGRQVNGRSLIARKVTPGDSFDGLHALYIGQALGTAGILNSLKGRPVLVVTDEPDGFPDGAALNFLLVDGRIRFEASAASAERAGLRLSARLLTVAERVVPP